MAVAAMARWVLLVAAATMTPCWCEARRLMTRFALAAEPEGQPTSGGGGGGGGGNGVGSGGSDGGVNGGASQNLSPEAESIARADLGELDVLLPRSTPPVAVYDGPPSRAFSSYGGVDMYAPAVHEVSFSTVCVVWVRRVLLCDTPRSLPFGLFRCRRVTASLLV
jgi:hypothetical protein